MRIGRVLLAVLFVAALLVTAAGCKKEKEPGLMERLGKSADSAVDKAKEMTGNVVDKTREKTGEAIEKTGEAVKP